MKEHLYTTYWRQLIRYRNSTVRPVGGLCVWDRLLFPMGRTALVSWMLGTYVITFEIMLGLSVDVIVLGEPYSGLASMLRRAFLQVAIVSFVPWSMLLAIGFLAIQELPQCRSKLLRAVGTLSALVVLLPTAILLWIAKIIHHCVSGNIRFGQKTLPGWITQDTIGGAIVLLASDAALLTILVCALVIMTIAWRHSVIVLMAVASNHCLKCGYALCNLATGRCPECGVQQVHSRSI